MLDNLELGVVNNWAYSIGTVVGSMEIESEALTDVVSTYLDNTTSYIANIYHRMESMRKLREDQDLYPFFNLSDKLASLKTSIDRFAEWGRVDCTRMDKELSKIDSEKTNLITSMWDHVIADLTMDMKTLMGENNPSIEDKVSEVDKNGFPTLDAAYAYITDKTTAWIEGRENGLDFTFGWDFKEVSLEPPDVNAPYITYLIKKDGSGRHKNRRVIVNIRSGGNMDVTNQILANDETTGLPISAKLFFGKYRSVQEMIAMLNSIADSFAKGLEFDPDLFHPASKLPLYSSEGSQ